MLKKGFTLIELMAGMALGLIVVLAGTMLYTAIMSRNAQYLREALLGQDMDTAMLAMSRDIRRAGYDGAAASSIGSRKFGLALDPFVGAVSGTDYYPIDTRTAGCILFSYDLNKDGILQPATEVFGFRLKNGVIQSRTGGSVMPSGCGDSSNVWSDLTDEKSEIITSLAFSLDQTSIDVEGRAINLRKVNIEMQGHLPEDPAVVKTLPASVRVRNDWIS